MIGDPSGRTSGRANLALTEGKENTIKISKQLKNLFVNVDAAIERLGFDQVERSKKILNNFNWFKHASFLEILGTLAPGMKIGAMLGRDRCVWLPEKGPLF